MLFGERPLKIDSLFSEVAVEDAPLPRFSCRGDGDFPLGSTRPSTAEEHGDVSGEIVGVIQATDNRELRHQLIDRHVRPEFLTVLSPLKKPPPPRPPSS